MDLLGAVDCPVGQDDTIPTLEVASEPMRKAGEVLKGLGVERDQRMVLIHPGSGGSARDWSVDNFGLLARRLTELPGVRVVIAGSAAEERLVRRVWGLSGKKALVLTDRLNLREYAGLSKPASLFIAKSTGPPHISAAVCPPGRRLD